MPTENRSLGGYSVQPLQAMCSREQPGQTTSPGAQAPLWLPPRLWAGARKGPGNVGLWVRQANGRYRNPSSGPDFESRSSPISVPSIRRMNVLKHQSCLHRLELSLGLWRQTAHLFSLFGWHGCASIPHPKAGGVAAMTVFVREAMNGSDRR